MNKTRNHIAVKFRGLFWLVGKLVIVGAAMTSIAPAMADTTFVNLSSDSVRVARYFYTDGNSGEHREQGWVFKGWTVVEGGEAFVSESDHFYLEYRKNDKAITYADLKESKGYVKHGGPFEGFLPRNGDAQRRLIDKGYKAVTFRKFEDKVYKISGDEKYRLAEKDIPFNYESRSVKFLNEKLTVPGKIISIDYDYQDRGAKDISFTFSGGIVNVGGSIEGRQVRPFGPREPGYLRGTVKVKYIAPR